MKKWLALLFLLVLVLLVAGATAESKPTVSFPERSGSMNGGFDYELTVCVNRAQSGDLPIALSNAATGEVLSLVIPAGKTSASLTVSTQPVTSTVKTTYSILASDAYSISGGTHVLNVMPLPTVRFYNKFYSANAGYQIRVNVYCLNPETICKQNNVFTLKDQRGNVLAQAAWTRPYAQKEIPFTSTEQMYGRNDLTLWLGDYCVSEAPVYTLITGKKFSGAAIWSVSTDLPVMAIGIDCGDKADNTDKVLEVLSRHNVKATFFMTGRFLRVYPEAVKKIYAAGHEIGTHSESHKHMSQLSIWEDYNEIMAPVWRAEELLGVSPRLFRPPYGEYSNSMCAVARSEGMEMIRWDTDFHDSLGTITVEGILAYATTHYDYQPGSIVLCHLQGDGQPDTLDYALTYYESLGLNPIPISALLCASGQGLPAIPDNRPALVYTDEYWQTWIEREMPQLLPDV